MQDPRGDRPRHRLDARLVGLVEALPARLVLGQDPADDLVARVAQRGHRGQHLERAEPALEAGELGGEQALGPARLDLAAGGVAIDDRLDVVDVTEDDPGDVAAGRVDVPRDGEVDQQQRPVLASGHHVRSSSSRSTM